MAFENTITEQDLDGAARQWSSVDSAENQDYEPDLAVDGLSDSLLSRLLGLFGSGRAGK